MKLCVIVGKIRAAAALDMPFRSSDGLPSSVFGCRLYGVMRGMFEVVRVQ